jgi:cell division protein FtsW
MHNKRVIHNILIFVPIFLVIMGMCMVYSASCIFAAKKFADGAFFLKKQALFAICGIIGMFAIMRVPYRHFRKCAYPLIALSIVLLIAVFIPGIGRKAGGACRWLWLGPISFQPSEFAKLAVIIFLSYSLAKKEQKIKIFSIGVLPHLMMVLPIAGLVVLQPDFGTTIIFVVLLFGLLFVAGVPRRYLAALCLAAAAAALPLLVYKGAYRIGRLLAFLDPWGNYRGAGYHIVQSFLAFGSGGVWGRGLGSGVQKLLYLPEPHTDFVLAVIGEEFGFAGVVLVIILFGAVLLCGIQVALNACDLFGTYLALGITFLIGLQVIINMNVVLGLLPTKGTTLPFISYGGTSLVMNLLSIGILVGISDQSDCRVRQ